MKLAIKSTAELSIRSWQRLFQDTDTDIDSDSYILIVIVWHDLYWQYRGVFNSKAAFWRLRSSLFTNSLCAR